MHEQYVNTFIIFHVLHAGSYNLLVGDIPFLWLLIYNITSIVLNCCILFMFHVLLITASIWKSDAKAALTSFMQNYMQAIN